MKYDFTQLIPFAAELAVEAPALVTQIEGIFVKHGATEEDLKQMRDETRALADKLGHPANYFEAAKL